MGLKDVEKRIFKDGWGRILGMKDVGGRMSKDAEVKDIRKDVTLEWRRMLGKDIVSEGCWKGYRQDTRL